jgi:hypothetical protein
MVTYIHNGSMETYNHKKEKPDSRLPDLIMMPY